MALAPYACMHPRCGSRPLSDSGSEQRTAFQRDCDRIVHSTSFRLLMYKTQVFVAPVCGHFRTRLTHTIEVARVARAIASSLGLNPDLAESVSLAHDLGHTPFGHIGEQALNEIMKDHGGFEHNAQAVRIVTNLERSYIGFNGLNLTWETLEGIAKHNGPVDETGLAMADAYADTDLELHTYPSAEAQVAALADDIAYNCHDMQDGLRAEFFAAGDLTELPLIGPAIWRVRRDYSDVSESRINQTALREVFGELVEDVYRTSMQRFDEFNPQEPDDIRNAGCATVSFSEDCRRQMNVIRDFLFDRMYRNERVNEECAEGSAAIRTLFNHYRNHPSDLPAERLEDYHSAVGDTGRLRAIADCIAGLTDSFALKETARIATAS